MALITAIVPTYRRPALLRKTIESILGQTFPDFVIHVHDDASKDNTHAVVDEMATKDPRIKYFGRKENAGMFVNQKEALQHIETPYFSFLHDDDVLLPVFFETALANFKKYPAAMFSTCVTVKQGQKGNVYHANMRKWVEGLYSPPEGLLKIVKDGMPHWSAILFRKEVIKKVGVLDEEVGHFFDHDYLNRISAQYPICASKTPGSIYVFHGDNYGSMADDVLQLSAFAKTVENITSNNHISPDVRDQFLALVRQRYKKQCLVRALLLLKDKRFEPFAQCVDVLKYLNWHREAFWLSTLGKVCKFSLVPFMLRFFYDLMRWFQQLRLRQRMNHV